MNIETGKTYPTKEDALKDGVPESDIAEVDREEVKFSSGPFKGRVYKRVGKNLIRTSLKRGDQCKYDSKGVLVRIRHDS